MKGSSSTKPTAHRPPIDEGLRQLVEKAEPNRTYTQEEIAKVCKCHRGRISQIEKAALKKLRNTLIYGRNRNLITKEDVQ